MQVELLDGPMKGQIVSMPFHVAQPLIEQGRARDIRQEISHEPEGIESEALEPKTQKAIRPNPRRK